MSLNKDTGLTKPPIHLFLFFASVYKKNNLLVFTWKCDLPQDRRKDTFPGIETKKYGHQQG